MQPTVHRVINADPSKSRVSLPFFYEPAFEAVVAPLGGLCPPSNPPRVPPVRYGSHLESKVLPRHLHTLGSCGEAVRTKVKRQ